MSWAARPFRLVENERLSSGGSAEGVFAVREPPDLAEPADEVDLGGRKDREHLVEPRRQDTFSGDSGSRWSS